MGDDKGESTAEFAVLTDEPIVVPQPRRAVARVAISFGLAILVVGASAAYIGATIGYDRASGKIDRRVAAIERYQDERRGARDSEKAQADAERAAAKAELARLRAAFCVLADRAQPRDAEIDRVRAEFGCTGGPLPVPSVTPTGLPLPEQPRGDGRQPPGPPAGSGRAADGDQPNPVPQPPAQPPNPPDEPEPEPEPDDGLLCLPLLGCLF